MRRFNLLLSLLFLLIFSACDKDSFDDKDSFEKREVIFEEVYFDFSASGSLEAQELVIDNQALWSEKWSDINGNRIPEPDLPLIDFEKSVLIMVVYGSVPTGGYSIKVRNIMECENEVEVMYDKLAPDPDALLTQAFTNPIHVVEITKQDKKIIFK